MTDIAERFDNMVGHIISINDDRDIVPLLLGLKEMWPQVRTEIERLRRLCQDLSNVQRQNEETYGKAADEIERLREELRNPIMRRMEDDRFGISICWDDHMISGMQKSTDEVWRIVQIVKMLRDEYPDLHAHMAKIADQMLKLIERTQTDRRYDADAIEELRRDFPDLFTKVV